MAPSLSTPQLVLLTGLDEGKGGAWQLEAGSETECKRAGRLEFSWARLILAPTVPALSSASPYRHVRSQIKGTFIHNKKAPLFNSAGALIKIQCGEWRALQTAETPF